MAIPDYQTLMLPVLRSLADGQERSRSDLVETISNEFRLTEGERQEMLSSGQSTVIRNRVGWAQTYLKKARLIESPRRGRVRITDRGSELLRQSPQRIDSKFLERYSEFVEFLNLRHERPPEAPTSEPETADESTTPEEALEAAYQRLRSTLDAELLEQVKAATPAFFERLVVELLVKMGYGGSLRDAGQAVGRSGDGGIDGIIKEDRLGLDVIYIQAKRWDNNVPRPEVQKFAGALQGNRARKGVFITTSGFSRDALDYVRTIEAKIVLIDGALLAKLMIDNNVGVSTVGSYEVKKIDSDYFVDE